MHIAAHSSGEILASHFAQEQSDRVKKLAWFNPPDLDRIKAGDVAAWEKAKSGFGSIQEATLLVAADYDIKSSTTWVEKLATLIPNCDKKVVKKCGQFSLHEKKMSLWIFTAHFWRRVEAAFSD